MALEPVVLTSSSRSLTRLEIYYSPEPTELHSQKNSPSHSENLMEEQDTSLVDEFNEEV